MRVHQRGGPGAIDAVTSDVANSVPGSTRSGPLLRSRGRALAIELTIDLAAPILLTIAAAHELLYDHAGWVNWLFVLSVIWPLVWRRRAPLVVFALCLVLAAAFWATDTLSVADLSVLVALYTVAAHRDTRDALAVALTVEIGAVLIAVRFAPADSINDAIILLSGLVAAALFLGTTARAQRRYLASVEDRARRLERERSQQAQLAAASERTRIAREMHDIVAHSLSVVITLAQGAAIAVADDPPAAARAMEQAAAAGRQSLDEMRKLLHVLRTDGPGDKDPQPSLAMLELLIEDVRRTGLTVHVVSRGDSRHLGATAQTTVYRIVQEALTNVLKHADHASTVSITLDCQTSDVRFAIENDGRPVPQLATRPTGLGNGLTGMRERVAMFGGSLDSGPSPTGWLVHGHLPTA